MRLSLVQIASVLDLPAQSGWEGILLDSLATDSRDACPRALFACIPGERTDGHNYAASAVERGAAAILTMRKLENLGDIPQFVVPDSVAALGKLAAYWRKQTKATVIGITGTCGKTTLKEILVSLLGKKHSVAFSPMNNNNQIGLPRSMLNASGKEDYWIMEVGISRDGDMDELGAILRPDLALILNVGQGHTAGLGKSGVARQKARLLGYLSQGGRALISADYPDLLRESRAYPALASYFSAGGLEDQEVGVQKPEVAFYGQAVDAVRGHYRLNFAGKSIDVHTPFRGLYAAENLIAAGACVHLLGLEAKEIAEALSEVKLPAQRYAQRRIGRWLLVDDSYNANPLSMRRMLKTASEQAKEADLPLYLVLGAMGELGADAAKEHCQLGDFVAGLNPRAVFWLGEYALEFRKGLEAGLGRLQGIPFWTLSGAKDFLPMFKECCPPGNSNAGLIIFKGSRLNHLEECIREFESAFSGGAVDVL